MYIVYIREKYIFALNPVLSVKCSVFSSGVHFTMTVHECKNPFDYFRGSLPAELSF